jgi:hypothetical protein
MDPLSITTACLSLLGAVAKTSLAVTTFVRGCREARSDLSSISGELTQLHLVLDLLKDDASVSDGRVIPESLQAQILSIIKNCSVVIDNIDAVLRKHSGKTGAVKWVAFGKAEVAGLHMSLEAHRGSLNLVLELVSVSMSKAIMTDVAVVRQDVHDIKHDTGQIPQIMAELTRLRAIVAAGETSMAIKGQNYVLEQYLDSLTSYAETVCNDVVWDDSDGSLHAPSRKPSLESVGDSAEHGGAQAGGVLPPAPKHDTGEEEEDSEDSEPLIPHIPKDPVESLSPEHPAASANQERRENVDIFDGMAASHTFSTRWDLDARDKDIPYRPLRRGLGQIPGVSGHSSNQESKAANRAAEVALSAARLAGMTLRYECDSVDVRRAAAAPPTARGGDYNDRVSYTTFPTALTRPDSPRALGPAFELGNPSSVPESAPHDEVAPLPLEADRVSHDVSCQSDTNSLSPINS